MVDLDHYVALADEKMYAMKVKTYGSIYIGTYEVSLRIYEVKNREKKRLNVLMSGSAGRQKSGLRGV